MIIVADNILQVLANEEVMTYLNDVICLHLNSD